MYSGERLTMTTPDDDRELRRDTRRRFEQWARNPHCQANALSAVHNVPMADVAKHEGHKPTMGQSPFAIQRGQTFERSLFRDEGEALRSALQAARLLPAEASGLADFRLRLNGGPFHSLDDARSATSAWFARLAERDHGVADPWLAAGATVSIPGGVMLPEAILVLDALVVRHDTRPRTLIVGEIKTYPDRGGFTDPSELATARAQAGVYVHGLELVLDELHLKQHVSVSNSGFLVLTRPGFNRPSIRPGEDLRYQATRARRGFELLRVAAEGLPRGSGKAGVEEICGAPVHYQDTCVTFCDRASLCRTRALEAGNAAALGDDVARFLGDISLTRALTLLGGAPPATPAEADLSRRFQDIEALRTLR
jgi:hypothetical protein